MNNSYLCEVEGCKDSPMFTMFALERQWKVCRSHAYQYAILYRREPITVEIPEREESRQRKGPPISYDDMLDVWEQLNRVTR